MDISSILVIARLVTLLISTFLLIKVYKDIHFWGWFFLMIGNCFWIVTFIANELDYTGIHDSLAETLLFSTALLYLIGIYFIYQSQLEVKKLLARNLKEAEKER